MLKGREKLLTRLKRLYLLVMTILFALLLYLVVQFLPILHHLWRTIIGLLAPFLIAAFISYLLYPITEKLTEWKLKQSVAVIIIYSTFFVTVGLTVYYSFPVIMKQLTELAEQLPQLTVMYEQIISSLYEHTAFLPEVFHDKMTMAIQQIEQEMEKKIEILLESWIHLVDYVLVLTIIPVLVFYILIDYERVKKTMYKLLSYAHIKKLDTLLYAVDRSLGSYIRGQLFISAFVTLISFLIYHSLQLKYGLLLAVIMGVMNIIPYFGPIIGTIPALLVALGTSWKLALVIILTNMLIQIIENSFLSPYIMGKSVQIHPILIIFILLVGAELGGVVGMIIAVPLITVIKAIFEEFLKINSNAIDF